jgi:hypothetical protein
VLADRGLDQLGNVTVAQGQPLAIRATSGATLKNKRMRDRPSPLRAYRLPFGLSFRMMRPASTRVARCRRNVVGAMNASEG